MFTIIYYLSAFFIDGFTRLGIDSAGLPLERKNGKLVIHLVHGSLPAKSYSYDSGNVTKEEIRRALNGTIDFDREFLLVFYGLCHKEADSPFVFNAPYYGNGSQRAGICHAADCELLDPLLLTDTKNRIVFTEHYYPRREESVAGFNSMYLGGVAHELGHGLGLPHDNGGNSEKKFGVSLMGLGNLTYRRELWGGGTSSYFGRASILLLASHPLFTRSDRGRWDDTKSEFQSLQFSTTNQAIRVQGVVTGAIPPYAVIAYLWTSNSKSDHYARTFPCVVKEGAFDFIIDSLPADNWHLRLARLHANGSVSSQHFDFRSDPASGPDIIALNSAWLVESAEKAVMRRQPSAREFVSDSVIATPLTPESARKLRLLRSIIDSIPPTDLATVQTNNVFLSDVIWTEAKVGWGQVARNYFWFDDRIQNGVFLTLAGQFYDKGLFAHSPARYVFPLNGRWKTFGATIGLRDGAHSQGSAIFTVRGDGKELYRSRKLRVGEREEINVNVSDVKQLELLTDGAEGHNRNSWAIWAKPIVRR